MAFSGSNYQGGFPFLYPGYQQIPFSPYGGYPFGGQQFYGGGSRMSVCTKYYKLQ